MFTIWGTMEFLFFIQWKKIRACLDSHKPYRKKLDYLYFIRKECKTRLADLNKKQNAKSSSEYSTTNLCSECSTKYSSDLSADAELSSTISYILKKTDAEIEYYEDQINLGKESDETDLTGMLRQVLFLGYRMVILCFIRALIKEGFIGEATDEQICSLFYCSKETDNVKFPRTTPFMLRWLKQDNILAFLLCEMRAFKCFRDFHYFRQFEDIIVRADGTPITDLSFKKHSADSTSEDNQKLLQIIKELSRMFYPELKVH